MGAVKQKLKLTYIYPTSDRHENAFKS